MYHHTIPYFGDVAFRRRDYAMVAGTVSYFVFSLFVGVVSGWNGSVFLGIGLCIAASVIILLAASKRSMEQTSGDYRFGETEE